MLSVGALVLAAGATGAFGATLVQPAKLTCDASNPVSLTVIKSRITISGAQFDSRVYSTDGVNPSMPGPTIVMVPGSQCKVTIKNDLPADGCDANTPHSNVFHCASTTNLHTHGLHIGPDEDDVSSSIYAQTSRTYTYNMPSNHLMGTHWYHAHRHGSTALHVSGGMAGTLMVKAGSSIPTDLAALYGADGLGGKLAVMQHLFFSGGSTGADAFDIPDSTQIQAKYPASENAFGFNPVFADAAMSNTYVVNGQYQPTLDIVAGEVTLVRFVHAAGSRILSLELTGTGASSCTMQLLARDGVFQKTPYPVVRAVAMFTATRSDIALRCGDAAVGSTDLAFAAADTVFKENMGTGADITLIHLQGTVMKVAVAARAAGAADAPFPTTQATFPSYLADISGASLATFDAGGTTGSLLLTAGAGEYTINGNHFAGFTSSTRHAYKGLCLDSVYEFTASPPPPPGGKLTMLRGGGNPVMRQGGGGAPPATSMHPLHIHIDHMLITKIPDIVLTGGEIARVGEWRDTMGVTAPNGFTFRMQMRDYVGDMVLHCHITAHEDQGMMSLMERKSCSTSGGGGSGGSGSTPSPTVTPGSSATPTASPGSSTNTTGTPDNSHASAWTFSLACLAPVLLSMLW